MIDRGPSQVRPFTVLFIGGGWGVSLPQVVALFIGGGWGVSLPQVVALFIGGGWRVSLPQVVALRSATLRQQASSSIYDSMRLIDLV